MQVLISALILFVALAVVIHAGSLLISIYAARRTRRPVRAPSNAPAVTLLRPACGIENNVAATLESSFRLDYPNYEIVFCVQKDDDPIIPIIQALMAENDHIESRLLIGDDKISINPKLNNLVKGWEEAAHEWVVMTDSNVMLPADYIQYLFSYFDDETGLVCSPAVGGAPRNLAAELECAFLNEHEARWQITADQLGRGFAQGKTMLWRRDVLNNAGGISALASEPAEDAASTKVVRQAGLKVRLMPGPFLQPLGLRNFDEVWQRQVRWARLRRTSFPWLYAPEVLTGGFLPLAAAALLTALGVLPLAGLATLAAAWYGGEILLSKLAGWHVSWRSPVVLLLRDILLVPLWAAGWLGNTFVWRGNAMDIADVQPAPAPWFRNAEVREVAGAWRLRINTTYRRWRRWSEERRASRS